MEPEPITHFISLIDEKNSHLTYRGKIQWSGYNFRIKIIANDVAYDGHGAEENLAEQCNSLKLTLKKYIGECQVALSNASSENGFSVTIDNDQFYIKKQLNVKRPSLMKIKFLKVSLQRVDFFEAITEILDSAFCENNNFLAEKSRLRNEIESLKEDNREATNCLKKITQEKINLEEILYTKFCYLLNAKKKYYQTLLKWPIDDSKSNLFRSPEAGENSSTAIEKNRLDELYNADTDDDEASNDLLTKDSSNPVKMETNIDTNEARGIPSSIDICEPIKMKLEIMDEPQTSENTSALNSSKESASSSFSDSNSSISPKSNADYCIKPLSGTVKPEIENTSETILHTKTVESIERLRSASRVANILDTMSFLDPTIPF